MADKIVKQIKQGTVETDIGIDASNVFITYTDNHDPNSDPTIRTISVQQFFNEWWNFKTNAKFMQYGEGEPSNSQVKLWLQKPSSNNNS